MIQIQTDAKGQPYVEVENVRITYVKAVQRDPGKDWPGCDDLRIQAYRGDGTKSLHMGAELPISGWEVLSELKAALEVLEAYIKKHS
ncbi:MAG TPA: hypothetical protein GXX19_10640 [Syntrophomonadaceae bacterium]|nr:hypothetical protein [Syntrophomonadaceae bacterium]